MEKRRSMMPHVLSTVLLAATLAAVQVAPSGQVFKSSTGTCQVTVPADWKLTEFAASDPAKTLNVMVLHEQDAKVEVLDPVMLKGVYGAEKVFENTAQRLFVQSQTQAFGPEPASTKWESLVPTKPKGSCQVIIVFKKGGSEAVARAIVMSLAQGVLVE
jgi:hypothetical protein